jgi:methyl-accepting chemotaxis protein
VRSRLQQSPPPLGPATQGANHVVALLSGSRHATAQATTATTRSVSDDLRSRLGAISGYGSIARSSCIGFNRDIGKPPDWFAALCDWIPAARADVVRPISYRGRSYGTVVVTIESAAITAAIWKEVSGLLGLTGLVIGAICILQYGAISRALRPTKDILAGLDRLARGDLSCRLPNFRLIELQRISEVFNKLAASLDRTTREKTELAAKLVDNQEQERLDLARDLHDELAQSLSAMSAVAPTITGVIRNACLCWCRGASRLEPSFPQDASRVTTIRPVSNSFPLLAGLACANLKARASDERARRVPRGECPRYRSASQT